MWGARHLEWLRKQAFEHPAQQIAFQGYLRAVEQAEARRRELEEQIAILLPSLSLAPVVNAMLALRGVAPIIAVSIVAEKDFGRFASPRQLMAYLGSFPVSTHQEAPSERGESRSKGTVFFEHCCSRLLGRTASHPRSASL
jgi:transposase